MAKNIVKLALEKMPTATKKRVAAYARISMESERMNHSLSSQISYYNDFIQKHADWQFVGIYSDEGISGTGTTKRDDFNRMVRDCEEGKIDIILTKSISRFARNTIDLLNTTRRLKELGISVRFEKENIDSLSEDGELMLTLLASFAQEESLSISENIKWATKKRFEKGIPNGEFIIYGYRWVDHKLTIYEEEAQWVRYAFEHYLAGDSCMDIIKYLNANGVKTYKGCAFQDSTVRTWLTNITYTGNLILQKEYKTSPIDGKRKKNKGELTQYFVESHHEPIVSMELFQAVNAEKKRRAALGPFGNKSLNTSVYTSRIKCGCCGKSYVRSTTSNKGKYSTYGEKVKVWSCVQNKKKGRRCPGKQVVEKKLIECIKHALGVEEYTEDLFRDNIEKVIVYSEEKRLEIHLLNGEIKNEYYTHQSHKASWTEERKKEWSELKQRRKTSSMGNKMTLFTSLLKCGACGGSYRRGTVSRADGTKFKRWNCPTSAKCHVHSIKEETLIEKTKEVLGVEELTNEIINANIEYIEMQDKTLIYHLVNQETKSVDFDEHLKAWSYIRWQRLEEKRNGKSNSDTRDNNKVR